MNMQRHHQNMLKENWLNYKEEHRIAQINKNSSESTSLRKHSRTFDTGTPAAF